MARTLALLLPFSNRYRYEYVAFDHDSQSADMSHAETVVAINTSSPKNPDTNLSRASGLQLERVGEWIFAFEARRIVSRSKIDKVVDDIINLLEYAKGFSAEHVMSALQLP